MRLTPVSAGSGSSPRAWGTLARSFQWRGTSRFIPTGVGNTSTSRRSSTSSAVHPHGRGEHAFSVVISLPIIGSSPRAWGTQPAGTETAKARRFIPTGVGNTTGDH